MSRCKILVYEWAALILKKKYGSYDICNYVAITVIAVLQYE
jgi:hypothetical protein